MQKSIKTEIIINASKEKVWKILTDFNSYPAWNPFIVRIKGELAKGKRLAATLLTGKTSFNIRPKVQGVTPFRSFEWLGSLFIRGLFDGHHFFVIEEHTPKQVKLIHGEHFSGLLSAYILNKIGDDTRNNFIRMNTAIKSLAESGNSAH